jgi:predicted amidohydrolase
MENAIAEGWARVVGPREGETVLLPGREGLDHYLKRNTEVYVSFPVNSAAVAIALAVAKTNDCFSVYALSSDGGGIPRNTTLRQGLALVRFGALSLDELVIKACVNPARMLGLSGKGHIGLGADADVIVVDPCTAETEWVMAHGTAVVQDGRVVGDGGRLLTTEAGRTFLYEQCVESILVAPEWLK